MVNMLLSLSFLPAIERWSEQLWRGWGHTGENITSDKKEKSEICEIYKD